MRRAPILLAMLAGPAAAQLSEHDLASAVASPPADARLPAALRFIDAAGRPNTLGAVAAGRPLVLLFADFTCRHVCGPGLTLTAGALHDSGLVAERDYALAVVGIDPRDDAADARAMAQRIAVLPDVARATTLLLGDAPTIGRAERALGYGEVYDPATDQFAHDAAVYIFARDGRLTALLPELALRPESLRAAITAPPETPPTFADRVAHLCYGFAAAHGRYGRPVALVLQALAAATLLGAGLSLLRRWRKAS